MKQVWFIRHGESEANAGLASIHPGSIPLTSRGIAQAEAVSKLITEQPQLFVVSPYIRTQQTAKATLEKFSSIPVEIWPIQEYDFLSPAVCAGTTTEERKPMVRDYWERCGADYIHGDGAESFVAFKERTMNCIKRIEDSPYHFIVVFAHGHFIRAVWQYLLTGNSLTGDDSMRYYKELMVHLPVDNTAIFKACHDGRSWQIIDPC